MGFQENLNKRNGQKLQVNKTVVQSQYNDTGSTKYNSYLVKSFGLLTHIKSKKTYEFV